MREVVFQGALDPHTAIGQGWLRASHRKLDTKLTRPFRPYHTHDEKQPLKPGQVYKLDIEIIPTCIVVPKSHRIALTIRGRDYVYPGGSGGRLSNMKNEFTGNGPFLHDDPRDRPLDIFGGKTTLHLGGGRENFVLLPIIPPRGFAPAGAKKSFEAGKTSSEEKAAVISHTPDYIEEPQSLREARLNNSPTRRENSWSPADPSGRQSFNVTRPLALRGRAMTRAPVSGAGFRETAT